MVPALGAAGRIAGLARLDLGRVQPTTSSSCRRWRTRADPAEARQFRLGWFMISPVSAFEKMQQRARAVPGWVKGIVLTGVFVVPFVWVLGDDNPFDWALASITALAGDEADFRHLLAYLVCVLVLLIPAGVGLQLLGGWRLRAANTAPDRIRSQARRR